MSNNGNEPIGFVPQVNSANGDIESPIYYGLTKREAFAAMAMQGFCANTHSWEEHNAADRAKQAVREADALLAELAKGT